MHTLMNLALRENAHATGASLGLAFPQPWHAARDSTAHPSEHQADGSCCAACGQALLPASQRLGIEVLSVRAGWRRRHLLRWAFIQALSCDNKYINIHDVDGVIHVIEDSLDRICRDAGSSLVRVHRGHAINPMHLGSLVSHKDGSCEFLLRSGMSVPGSRRLARSARLEIFGEPARRRRGQSSAE